MNNYTIQDYQNDLHGEIKHTESKSRFKSFYDKLGEDPKQFNQNYRHNRMKYFQPKGKIIELGCHWGFNLIHYARLGFEIVGIELSESLVKLGTERIAQESPEVQNRITLWQGWIEKYPTDVKFDSMLLTETLEHVLDPDLIIKKVYELLTADGQVYISSPSVRVGSNSHVRGISKEYLERLLRKYGLEAKSWPLIETDTLEKTIVCIAGFK